MSLREFFYNSRFNLKTLAKSFVHFSQISAGFVSKRLLPNDSFESNWNSIYAFITNIKVKFVDENDLLTCVEMAVV